jgi:hypothetical protein
VYLRGSECSDCGKTDWAISAKLGPRCRNNTEQLDSLDEKAGNSINEDPSEE